VGLAAQAAAGESAGGSGAIRCGRHLAPSLAITLPDIVSGGAVGEMMALRWRHQISDGGPGTIRSFSSDKGRCNAFASVQGARIQASISSGPVRITGIALGWIGATTAFGSVVRKAKMSAVTSPSLARRTPVQGVHIPANTNSGSLSYIANQCSGFLLVTGSGMGPYSEKEVAGTRQRLSGPSQRLQ